MRPRLLYVMTAFIALWLLVPGSSQAENLGAVPILTPSGQLEAVKANVLVMDCRLESDDSGTRWLVEQQWTIENADTSRDRALVLYLDSTSNATGIELLDEQSNTLTPQQVSGGYQWSLVCRAGKRASLVLRYATAKTSGAFDAWSLSGERLSAWGGIEGVRIHLSTPYAITEDAIARIGPSNYRLLGTDLMWDYENSSAFADHELLMLTPSTVRMLHSFETSGDHVAHAELLDSIHTSAQSHGIAWPDPSAEIAAAFQLAAAQSPGATEPLWALADFYLEQRAVYPDHSANYQALAAATLADIVSIDASDSRAQQQLNALYLKASREASQAGDLEGALEYISLAEANGAGSATQVDEQLLALRLSVALAKQGQPTKALEQIHDNLSPSAQEDIAHYAPPFAAAETHISYEPAQIVAETQLQLYPPLATQAIAEVQAMCKTIAALPGWSASLTEDSNACTVQVSLDRTRGMDEQGAREALVQAIHDDANLMARLLALPWEGAPAEYSTRETPWVRNMRFTHELGSSSVAQLYADQADYAGWRLAEIRVQEPSDAVAQLEQELIIAALGEQVTIWRQLPASCYWVTKVDVGDLTPTRTPLWILGWDQTQVQSLYAVAYRWGAIGASVGSAMAFVLLFGILAFWGKRGNA